MKTAAQAIEFEAVGTGHGLRRELCATKMLIILALLADKSVLSGVQVGSEILTLWEQCI